MVRARIRPSSGVEARARVPGDKSIAHRWLILASTAEGPSRLAGVPPALDLRSTASCLAAVAPAARPGLDRWLAETLSDLEVGGSTWNPSSSPSSGEPDGPVAEVEGEGRSGLRPPAAALDCGNAGTTMRLLAGVLAAAPFRSVLVGDASLSRRPMERVAEPLRAMGASVTTTDGHPPLTIRGGALRGVRWTLPVPTAQVKGAILLAGVAAQGETIVEEPAPTRDHTERALRALGGPVETGPGTVRVRPFQHPGFAASVPGDLSSAAFLVGAAALLGSRLEVGGVGLNPTRTHLLEVLGRMGVAVRASIERDELGEPVGTLRVDPPAHLDPVEVGPEELPLVIDEVPLLAALAAHADGPSRFAGAGELRLKESDRLEGIAAGLRGLGGRAEAVGDALRVEGGGLRGGRASSLGDHRLAIAFAVAGLAAEGEVEVEGFEASTVSFPGVVAALRGLGAHIEVST